MNKLKIFATNAGMFIKRHIPEILAAVGTVAVAWGTVEACKATRKLDQALDNCEYRKEEVLEKKDELEEREYKKEMTKVYVENGWELCKLYGPSALLIIGGLVSLNSGVVTLRRQNTALAAAYAVLRESFDDYRAKVKGSSPEAEKAEVEYIHSPAECREEGEELDRTKPITYTLLYDATTARNFSHYDGVNMTILKAKQRYLSQKLRGSETGVMTLNDICRELDLYIDSYKDGDSWGIIYDPRINGDQVDLGFEDDFMFAHGYEKSCWLHFNLVYVADRLPRIEEEMER